MTPWSAQGDVPTEVYLNWYPVRTDHVSQGMAITSVCSVFRLSRRSQYEPRTLGPVQIASSQAGEYREWFKGIDGKGMISTY